MWTLDVLVLDFALARHACIGYARMAACVRLVTHITLGSKDPVPTALDGIYKPPSSVSLTCAYPVGTNKHEPSRTTSEMCRSETPT